MALLLSRRSCLFYFLFSPFPFLCLSSPFTYLCPHPSFFFVSLFSLSFSLSLSSPFPCSLSLSPPFLFQRVPSLFPLCLSAFPSFLFVCLSFLSFSLSLSLLCFAPGVYDPGPSASPPVLWSFCLACAYLSIVSGGVERRIVEEWLIEQCSVLEETL